MPDDVLILPRSDSKNIQTTNSSLSIPSSCNSADVQLGCHLLASTNTLCATVTYQTPIHLDAQVASADGRDYMLIIPLASQTRLKNKGHMMEVSGVNGTLVFGGARYDLRSALLPTPCEHRIKDEYLPMEMIFVHKSERCKLAVVGFVIEIGVMTSPTLSQIFRQLAKIKNAGQVTDIAFPDFISVINSLANYYIYRYQGSLTTPLCAEGLGWIVSNNL
ncbi:alpha carbonic anhydrase [Calycina marina]|uniref:carbonic anhydrase n=1 Tax=Calycina marina TaxID=1763456 RepID=A0A9P7YXE2_9HELO|nr:alpha carbonic anhydrase [Calycina marina]